MSEPHPTRAALSFGQVADAYHRGRPSYPDDAVVWLLGDQAPLTVLEVGAGTGKLTERLAAAAPDGHHSHDLLATDPDAAMLAVLSEHLPDVRTSRATVDSLPVPDRAVDVVVGAQCYHWFDPLTALPEIARVLRPGGHVALLWNERDERIPWVRKLGAIIGSPRQPRDPSADLAASGLFDDVETAAFGFWQSVDRRTIVDLALSRSNLVAMDDATRERTVAELLALYDDYGRGMDGMQLPYLTRCFRARVSDRPEPAPEPDVQSERDEGESAGDVGEPRITDSATTLPRVAAGPVDDDAVLLISFS